MKHYLTLLLIAIGFSGSAFAQNKIGAHQAADFIGDTVRICEKVVSGTFNQTVEGKPTYLTLGTTPEAQIIVLIKGESRKWFDYKPEKDLLNRQVCVTGKLEMVDGKRQIVINRQDDISISK